MAQGDIISAARYNELQGKISAILGTGSGNKGYNQGLYSIPVGTEEIVYAAHMNRLYNDMVNIYVHQNGIVPSTIFQVADDETIADALYNEFNTLIAAAEADPQRFVIHSSQAVVESAGINSTRSKQWGGNSQPQTLTHEFKATFSGSNQRRAFFNAGGEIRFNPTLTHSLSSGDADYAKTNDWKNMLDAIGTIVFKHNETSANAGTPSVVGNFQLTSSYQQVYSKTGSGVYVDNDLTVFAKQSGNNSIVFKMVFTDDANGVGAADERVNGTLISAITQYRADGNYVDTPAPSWNNITLLQ